MSSPQAQIQAINSTIDELIDALSAMMQSGEHISDEMQGIIAQELEASLQQIEMLQSQGTTLPTSQASGPPSAAEQLMWILAGQREDVFLQYLHTYPDPELQRLLQNPTRLEQVIQDLHEMMPSGRAPTSQEGIPHAEINSSQIYGFAYDPNSKKLKVKFQGDNQSGPVYEYDNVPLGVYKAFEMGAVPAKTSGQNNFGRWWTGKEPSLGAAFHELIRMGGYNYRRMS